MNGLFHGKSYEQMDDFFGGFSKPPLFLENTQIGNWSMGFSGTSNNGTPLW